MQAAVLYTIFREEIQDSLKNHDRREKSEKHTMSHNFAIQVCIPRLWTKNDCLTLFLQISQN